MGKNCLTLFYLVVGLTATAIVTTVAAEDLSADFTGNFNDYGLDTDSDGLYNYLIVEVELNVSEEGNYSIYGNMYHDEWDWVDGCSNESHLDVGVHSLMLKFHGYRIYEEGYNGSFRIYVTLYKVVEDCWYFLNSTDYYTGEYNYTDFDSEKPAAFTGNFNDYGLDTDSDGLYNYLVIDSEIDVNESGNYEVCCYLMPAEGGEGEVGEVGIEQEVWACNETYLEAGAHLVPVNVPGYYIYRMGYNGSFIAYMDLYRNWEEWVSSDVYETGEYNCTDFNSETPAEFNDVYSDYGLDTNDNGLYDYLVIEVGVYVREAGVYTVWGDLYENETGSWVAWAENTTQLEEGDNVVLLFFDGNKLRENGYNGTYDLRWLELFSGGGEPMALVKNKLLPELDAKYGTKGSGGYWLDWREYAYTTSYYNYTEFEGELMPPVANFTYQPANPMINETVEFDASLSYDPDGCIISYIWEFGDGNSTAETSPTTNHSYATPGCYIVNLTVVDNDWLTDTTSKCIAVGCGDVNCDGSVNMGDVIALLYHVGYGQEICSEWAADVNGDSAVNMGDVIKLLYHVGYGEELECICCMAFSLTS